MLVRSGHERRGGGRIIRRLRIVSLCPSITESLVALGLAESLVGVTRWCVHPREVTARIRKVGGTKDPDLGAIRSLRPDLVFANAEENRREDVEELGRDLSVDVSHPRRVSDVPPLLRRFGRLTGTEEGAESFSSKVQEGLGRLESDLASRPAFRCVYLVWKNPWMAAGPRTYVADLLRLAGGTLSLEESSSAISPAYPVVSEDEILAARPDVLILPDEPYRFREKDAAYFRERLPASSRVVLVPGDDWCWHGVRTIRGLAAAEALAASARLKA
jgi:ABC-type Fe3+-hydroxamate transport system substrate-binding protein